MLHAISWTSFGKTILLLLFLYYCTIGVLYFRKDITTFVGRLKRFIALLPLGISLPAILKAQTADGNNGINQANTIVRSYFQTGTQLMYAIGALVGLIGAIRVYSIWNSNHREDVGKAAAGWFGSCIFLVIVATVIQSFFGL